MCQSTGCETTQVGLRTLIWPRQVVPRGYVSQCQDGARVRGLSRSGKPRLLLKLIPVERSFPTRPSLYMILFRWKKNPADLIVFCERICWNKPIEINESRQAKISNRMYITAKEVIVIDCIMSPSLYVSLKERKTYHVNMPSNLSSIQSY